MSLSEPRIEPLFSSRRQSSISCHAIRSHNKDTKRAGEGGEKNIRKTALRPARGVAQRKQHAAEGPHGAEAGGEDGVLEARDEQGAQEGGQVLGEVGVGALGCCFLCDLSLASFFHSFVSLSTVSVCTRKKTYRS